MGKPKNAKVGDRFILIKDNWQGKKGTLCELVEDDGSRFPWFNCAPATPGYSKDSRIAVEWEFLEPYVEHKKQKFSGFFDGNKTVIYVNGIKGESNCAPDDTYSALYGLLLAYCRATNTDTAIVDMLFKKPEERATGKFKSSHFNVGDLVNVHDGSWSLINRHGCWDHAFGIELKKLSLSVYAVNQKLPSTEKGEVNDTILQDTVTGDLVYIQERFLSLKESVNSLKSAHSVIINGVKYVKE
jgi:hypothetical protein